MAKIKKGVSELLTHPSGQCGCGDVWCGDVWGMGLQVQEGGRDGRKERWHSQAVWPGGDIPHLPPFLALALSPRVQL